MDTGVCSGDSTGRSFGIPTLEVVAGVGVELRRADGVAELTRGVVEFGESAD